MLHKALDLAFKTQQYDALQQMSSDLDANSDPALVQKCADYFITNEQYDKAVDLLAIAKKVRNVEKILPFFIYFYFSTSKRWTCA